MLTRRPGLVCILVLAVLALVGRHGVVARDEELDEEFRFVTCGSAVKLVNTGTDVRLHSHQVRYGSGSGQQSVTGQHGGTDPNSYWTVAGPFSTNASLAFQGRSGDDGDCPRGTPVRCGQTIRLRHAATAMFLHSHLHKSPISGNQEVSGYDGLDTGDNWVVECGGEHWPRERDVKLKHVDTGKYLATSSQYVYNRPIQGQLEVHATTRGATRDITWKVQEGVFFATTLTPSAS